MGSALAAVKPTTWRRWSRCLAQVVPGIGAGVVPISWWYVAPVSVCASVAQVVPMVGAGVELCWRRWWHFLAQVRFLGGDLRRKPGFWALWWRRSHPFFHTCATSTPHLRHGTLTPAPDTPGTCASGGNGVEMREGWRWEGRKGWIFSRGWVFWQKVCIFAGRERRRPGFGRRLLFSRAEASAERH